MSVTTFAALDEEALLQGSFCLPCLVSVACLCRIRDTGPPDERRREVAILTDGVEIVALLEILIPQMGEGLQEVVIVGFQKKPGDYIKRDELIYSMETDKAVMEVE